jgi:aldehyde:ferredoxin oxidoreductase
MKELFGWVGKILRVDLTTGRLSDQDIRKYAEEFIGGRGVNAKIAWDEIPPSIDAFDPENRLIVMTGPLTGTAVPGTGRIMFGGVMESLCMESPRDRSISG